MWRNGRGKTTFLNLLLGKYEYSGRIISSVAFDYFPYSVPDKEKMTGEVLQEVCPQASEKVADYLNRKKGFILVSHDRRFLDGCVDHILSLNRAGITVQRGNFSAG